jgi:two-component system chemotaxis response regulator CheY
MSAGRLNVLIVDDDADVRKLLEATVAALGHECRSARDGVEALRMHAADPADLILSDWQMPNMDGLELCQRIRERERPDAYTHFVFMTGLDDKEHFRLGVEAGADDYQTKPLDLDELEARLSAAARVIAVQRRLADTNAALRHDSQASFRLARHDPLTLTSNRLKLEEDLRDCWAQNERYGRRYSALLCDIDWFKTYNDDFGHPAGDRTLRLVADALRAELRQSDGLYRYGGEEFVVLLPEQSLESACIVAGRVRQSVQRCALRTRAGIGVVTVSIGVAELSRARDSDPTAWLARADAALYRAKSNGRNRYEVDSATSLEVVRSEPRSACTVARAKES